MGISAGKHPPQPPPYRRGLGWVSDRGSQAWIEGTYLWKPPARGRVYSFYSAPTSLRAGRLEQEQILPAPGHAGPQDAPEKGNDEGADGRANQCDAVKSRFFGERERHPRAHDVGGQPRPEQG